MQILVVQLAAEGPLRGVLRERGLHVVPGAPPAAPASHTETDDADAAAGTPRNAPPFTPVHLAAHAPQAMTAIQCIPSISNTGGFPTLAPVLTILVGASSAMKLIEVRAPCPTARWPCWSVTGRPRPAAPAPALHPPAVVVAPHASARDGATPRPETRGVLSAARPARLPSAGPRAAPLRPRAKHGDGAHQARGRDPRGDVDRHQGGRHHQDHQPRGDPGGRAHPRRARARPERAARRVPCRDEGAGCTPPSEPEPS